MANRREMLEVKVQAVNLANIYANGVFGIISPFFHPFVGKKVLKNNGELLDKIKAIIPTFIKLPNLHIFRACSVDSLGWTVRASATSKDGNTQSHEITVLIANLDGQVLSSMYEKQPPLRTDYTAEEIEQKRSTFHDKLYPFSEYDS